MSVGGENLAAVGGMSHDDTAVLAGILAGLATFLPLKRQMRGLVGFMVFNAAFNNILVISWRSVLLVEVTGGPGENHQPAASH